MAKNVKPPAGKTRTSAKTTRQRLAQSARLTAVQQAQQAAERRRENRIRLLAAVAVVALIAIVGIVIQANRAEIDEDSARPSGVTEAGGGVPAAGSAAAAAPLVEVYEDFSCPHCKEFEQDVGPTLEELAASGDARIVYRVVAFLGDDSVRAQAAAGCAADEGRFVDYHDVLFQRQGEGYSIDQLISYGSATGLTSSGFQQCVRDQTYESWATASTTAFTNRGVRSTPAVYIDGAKWEPEQFTPDGLLAAVAAAR
jgi:protein-disulfide isomerase